MISVGGESLEPKSRVQCQHIVCMQTWKTWFYWQSSPTWFSTHYPCATFRGTLPFVSFLAAPHDPHDDQVFISLLLACNPLHSYLPTTPSLSFCITHLSSFSPLPSSFLIAWTSWGTYNLFFCRRHLHNAYIGNYRSLDLSAHYLTLICMDCPWLWSYCTLNLSFCLRTLTCCYYVYVLSFFFFVNMLMLSKPNTFWIWGKNIQI